VNHPFRRESVVFEAPLPNGQLGRTHQLLRGAPPTLPNTTLYQESRLFHSAFLTNSPSSTLKSGHLHVTVRSPVSFRT